MQFVKKNSIFLLASVCLVMVLFILSRGAITFAASTPSLGAAAGFGVLAETYSNTSASTTVNGSVGFNTGPAVAPAGVHVIYGAGLTYSTATSNQGNALTALAAQPCTFSFAPGAIDLSTDTTHGPVGVYSPGVYCSAGAISVGGPLTLSGSGTYIFRPDGALTTAPGAVVTLDGASVCDVFWTPTAATTLAANTTFMGTVIDNAGITVGANTTWTGRALASSGTVTTGTGVTITVPSCGSNSPICPDSRIGFRLAGTRGSGASFTVNAAGDHATVTFDLAPGCENVPVTLASFKKFSASAELSETFPQTLIDKSTGVFSAGAANTLTVAIPSCQMQTDLIWGEFNFTELNNSNFLETTSRTADWIFNNIPCVPVSTASSIVVTKVVVNDNGGVKAVDDFPLFVNGAPVVSGVTNTFPANAAYTITETSDPNYMQAFSGDCDATGHISLVPGDIKVCIVTNNDLPPGGGPIPPVPPLIEVIKVPAPLALPDGPGPVTYTYTLRNIGSVPVSDITMVGDSCSPITLVSGDNNADATLDVNETWTFTCSTNLTETHTNVVTASGVANGITAVDIASATVVVGVPIVPSLPNTGGRAGGGGASSAAAIAPLIHVTKLPSPLALSIGGGIITYTNVVTNPGVAPLSNIILSDDRCSPVKYISGDTNGDSNLDTNEAWVYTCSSNLTGTTTNTVVAEGTANGLTARDFAVATVVVAAPRLPNTGGFVPGLPNTGYPPETTSNGFLTGILMLISITLIVVLKKRMA